MRKNEITRRVGLSILAIIPFLVIYGTDNEHGDSNAGSMYLIVYFIPCILLIGISTLISVLVSRVTKMKILFNLAPIILFFAIPYFPLDFWKPILNWTTIISLSSNVLWTIFEKIRFLFPQI